MSLSLVLELTITLYRQGTFPFSCFTYVINKVILGRITFSDVNILYGGVFREEPKYKVPIYWRLTGNLMVTCYILFYYVELYINYCEFP